MRIFILSMNNTNIHIHMFCDRGFGVVASNAFLGSKTCQSGDLCYTFTYSHNTSASSLDSIVPRPWVCRVFV